MNARVFYEYLVFLLQEQTVGAMQTVRVIALAINWKSLSLSLQCADGDELISNSLTFSAAAEASTGLKFDIKSIRHS